MPAESKRYERDKEKRIQEDKSGSKGKLDGRVKDGLEGVKMLAEKN